MARKKQITLPDDEFKSRNFRLELYEDWEADDEKGYLEFCDILSNIRKYSNYIAIRHDKDEWSYTDYAEKKEYMDSHGIKVGDLKKPHYHVVMKFENARFRSTLAKEIGMDKKFIIAGHNYKKDLEYLIHLNNEDKHLYDVNECFGPLLPDLKKFLNKAVSEEKKSNDILEIILSRDHWTLLELVKEINRNSLYSTFRQGWSIYKNIMEEHNLGIY